MSGDFQEFSEDYASWEDAERAAGGYSARNIFEKTRDALRKVRDGEAVYERDSVLFDHFEYEFPLLAGLLHAALANSGRLSVLDFGGSLGSSYFQNRALLGDVKELVWSIVEQSHYVECGQAEFETTELRFFPEVRSCIVATNPSVLLLGGVLIYLRDPYSFLRELCEYNFQYIILDRTIFSQDGADHIKLQRVPPEIYSGSYPVHFLSSPRVMGILESRYKKLYGFHETMFGYHMMPAFSELPDYRGYVFRRTDEAGPGAART